MSKKTFLFMVSFVVIIGAILFLFVFRTKQPPYELMSVQKGNIIQNVSASGIVEAPTKANLQFKGSGKIVFLNAKVGQHVKRGDILAKQDNTLLYSELEQLVAALKNQEYKLKSLKKNDVANHNDKYDRKAQGALVEQARADIETQKVKIAETVLVSPMDGIVTTSNSEIGEIAKPETTVVSIGSLEKLQLKVDVSESNIAKVKIGQKVKITLDAFGDDTEWKGTVSDIETVETIKSGAVYYKTTVFFEGDDERILSGMTANVWIAINSADNVILVPISAIQKKNEKVIVIVFQNNKAIEREINIGLEDDRGFIEVTSGLNEGEQVILGDKK